MNAIFFLIFSFWCLEIAGHSFDKNQEAICIVPVADLVGSPLGQKYGLPIYQNIPMGGKKGINACPRVHQILFHERVFVVDEQNDEYCINIPNVFYQTNQEKAPQSQYWILKKNLYLLNQHPKKIDVSKLPTIIDYEKKTFPASKEITLIEPYFSKEIGLSLSAGTRFVIQSPATKENSFYQVYALDPHRKIIRTISLPKNICFKAPTNREEQQKCFVKILKKWTHLKNGFIPYVWGGCSIISLCQDNHFIEVTKKVHKEKTIGYQWPSYTTPPYAGLDCTGLIARAAQLCGMPYFFKNSFTVINNMPSLLPHQKIDVGDFIWIPGHVMIISDLQKNLIIEARAYNHGFGKVHEIPLYKVFKNMNTFTDLERAYYSQEPLERLDAQEQPVQIIKNFKIVPLASLYS